MMLMAKDGGKAVVDLAQEEMMVERKSRSGGKARWESLL